MVPVPAMVLPAGERARGERVVDAEREHQPRARAADALVDVDGDVDGQVLNRDGTELDADRRPAVLDLGRDRHLDALVVASDDELDRLPLRGRADGVGDRVGVLTCSPSTAG